MPDEQAQARMVEPMLRSEESEFEPMVVQRRIFLLFCATVLTGVLLCTAYLIGRVPSFPLRASQGTGPTDKGAKILIPAAHERWVVAFLPNPPAPLPDSTSPFQPELATKATGWKHFPLKLDMVASEDAWVEVKADGHVTYTKLVRAEQTLSFEASERISMMTTNAAGLELRFNGEPVAASGAKRRVRTIEFTREGARDLNSGHRSRSLESPAQGLVAPAECRKTARRLEWPFQTFPSCVEHARITGPHRSDDAWASPLVFHVLATAFLPQSAALLLEG